MNIPVHIQASKKSEKIIATCTGVYQLLQYCSLRQAKRIANAANNNNLNLVYRTKSGVRASYFK